MAISYMSPSFSLAGDRARTIPLRGYGITALQSCPRRIDDDIVRICIHVHSPTRRRAHIETGQLLVLAERLVLYVPPTDHVIGGCILPHGLAQPAAHI
jgi:hypothetical protein